MAEDHDLKPQIVDKDRAIEDREREERERRSANIYLLIGAVVLIGIGVWLVNAMVDARKADDCMSSGRRNCSPIEAPPR